MPKGKRQKDMPLAVVQLKASELKNFVADQLRLGDQLSEYTGHASRARKEFCKRTHLDPTVAGWLVKLQKLDNPLRAQELLRQLNATAMIVGLFDQGDLFADAKEAAQAAHNADALPEARPGREGLSLDEAQAAFEANAHKVTHPLEKVLAEFEEKIGAASTLDEAAAAVEFILAPHASNLTDEQAERAEAIRQAAIDRLTPAKRKRKAPPPSNDDTAPVAAKPRRKGGTNDISGLAAV
jgi:hypothetical protein